MTTTNVISLIIGSQVIDQSIRPYIAGGPTMLSMNNGKPGACVNVFVDDVCVNPFIQTASILTANSGFISNTIDVGSGIYCNTTHAFGTVMGTQAVSGGHYIYVNENIVSVNVTPYGPANSNSFSSSNYIVGQLVFQSPTANVFANSYVGRVVYWSASDGSLHLETLQGTVANTTSAQTFYTCGGTQLSNCVNVVFGNRFPTNQTVYTTNNNITQFSVQAFQHTHGVLPYLTSNNNSLYLQGNVGSNVVNSTIQFVYGTGYGQNAKIIAVNGSLVTLNVNVNPFNGNTYYGIVGSYVNSWGYWFGWHWWAEDTYLYFPTGIRLVTVTDGPTANSNAATMKSTGTYHAVGQITTTSQTPVPSIPPVVSPASNTNVAPAPPTQEQQNNNQVINDPLASPDPMCQTFFTPKPTTQKTDNGIFLTSCDLWFSQKPTQNQTQYPVSVFVVSTVNGFPTTTILGQSTVGYEGIVTTDGVNTFPDQSNNSTNTHFVFDNPIYLAPGTEYGLVVYSESPSYNVWISDIGEFYLNSTRMVSPSPYIGSFFTSQNGTAWTPIQNRSLMFQLNKAVFSQSPVQLLFNLAKPYQQNVYMDSVLMHSSDVSFPPANISYGIKTVNANTGNFDGSFFSIFNNLPFSFGGDLSTSIISSNRRRVCLAGNVNSTQIQVTLATNDSDVSPMFHSERLSFLAIANYLYPLGISAPDITITSPGNHINAANIVVTISAPTGDNPIQATANVLSANLSGNNLIGINMINYGSGYVTSPTITITEAASPANATAVVNGEDSIAGGNGPSRYVTRQITLADGFDAGDLQVYMTAIRPQGTDINCYYKILGSNDSDTLSNKKWVLMQRKVDLFSPDQNTPIDLNFNTGLNSLGVPIGSAAYVQDGVQYPIGGKFKSFQIKIVLSAQDSTVPPIINNFRAIAVPSG